MEGKSAVLQRPRARDRADDRKEAFLAFSVGRADCRRRLCAFGRPIFADVSTE